MNFILLFNVFAVWTINAKYADKPDLAVANPYLNWPITGTPKLVISVKGEIREAWGLGSVWKTCCGTVYGMYYDEGSNKYIAMYLRKDEETSLGRVKFVKNFIM